jgi:hypothetical protein
MIPTVTPTVSPVVAVALSAVQVLNGIDYNTYMQSPTTNELALKQSIAASVSQATVENIVSFQVLANTRRKLQVSVESSNSITMTYVISLAYAGASYAAIANELNTSISTNKFDGYVNYYAGVSGATNLVGCTSSSVITTPVSSSSNGDNGFLNTGLSVVSFSFVISGACIVFGCVVWVLCWCGKRKRSGSSRDVSTGVELSPNPDFFKNPLNSKYGVIKFEEIQNFDTHDDEEESFGFAHHVKY